MRGDPLEYLLGMVERLVPTGYIGDGKIREMQDAAARIRLAQRGDQHAPLGFRRVETPIAPGPQIVLPAPMRGHVPRQEGDEWYCASCGKRWGASEDPPPCG